MTRRSPDLNFERNKPDGYDVADCVRWGARGGVMSRAQTLFQVKSADIRLHEQVSISLLLVSNMLLYD